VTEVAEILGVSRRTVQRFAAAGTLRVHRLKLGRGITVWRVEDIRALVERKGTDGKAV
jgi:excisionase family DNA binding protein